MTRLPDFVIIGAMKCATSTLHEQLARQPGLFMSRPKEPCFFSDDAAWTRGLDWYRELFAGATSDELCGESSTHYTKRPTYPLAVERMCAVLPRKTRFIYVMRHPVERLISHYMHEWSMGVISKPIDEAIESFAELVEYGRYAYQLRPYLDAFGAENVLPVFVPRLERRPQEVLEQVCRFLGLEGAPRWDEELARRNPSRERMRADALREWAQDLPGSAWVRRTFVRRGVRERIKDLWRLKERPELSPDSLECVQAIFDEDLAELGLLLGRSLSCATFDEVTAELEPCWKREARAEVSPA